MNTTHPDLTALTRAVCEFPGDDTPRLVLADKLDDIAGTVPCPMCKGSRTHPGTPSRKLKTIQCMTCSGTGTVSDGFAERAEFIRVQCELARTPTRESDYPLCSACDGDGLATGPPESRPCRKCDSTGKRDHKAYKHTRRLLARERELLTDDRRRQWAPVTCPVCGGSGGVNGVGCFLCDAYGFAPVEFRRGFVESVRCRMVDAIRVESVGPWFATKWALDVAETHPTIERWYITNLSQYDNGSLPEPIYQTLLGIDSEVGAPTEYAELVAMAVGRWVKSQLASKSKS